MNSKEKVSDLTIDELRSLIAEVVKESIEDILEDLTALSSESYLKSIEEARADYKAGRGKRLEEVELEE